MVKVFINKIDLEKSEFDYEKLNSLFDFYLIENKSGKFKLSSKILDEPLLSSDILAIQYTAGNSFIVMMKKNNLNESRVAKIITDYNCENDNGLCKKKLTAPFGTNPHSLIQILFNSLAKSNGDISNLTGKLFYFSEKTTTQIYCVELKIDYSYSINLASKTFTKIKHDDKQSKKHQKKFLLENNNTLRLKSEKDKSGDFYTLSQYRNTKHTVTFANMNKPTLYNSSRVGILTKVLKSFNKEYSGIVKLVLLEKDDWDKLTVRSSASQKKEHLRNIKKILKDQTIRIIDKVGDVETADFAEELKESIQNIFQTEDYFYKGDNTINFSVKITDKIGKKDLNLLIIRDKKYYELHKEKKDLHEVSSEFAIQNVTYDSFPRDKKTKLPAEAATIVLLNELIVKKDLIDSNKKISIFEWASKKYENKWSFCICDTEEIESENESTKKVDHYYFMTIAPDGTFEIGEKTKDLFNQKEFDQIQSIFQLNNMTLERHNRYDEKYRALVINEKGEINIIQDTPNIMLPDMENIFSDITKMKLSRSMEALEKYYAACLDLYYKKEKDCEYYSSGQIGAGMQNIIEKATHIRKIIPYETENLFFKEMMDLMNVTFIRNSQLTVMPFPIKYLREYIAMNK